MLDAYDEYKQQGLRPVKCFPNSVQPLWSELQSDDVTDEDMSGWEDYNVGVRAHKNMSALVFPNYSTYTKFAQANFVGTPMDTAPVIMHPDASVAVWFKNTAWKQKNESIGDALLVNIGVLPAPPTEIGGITTEFLQQSPATVLPSHKFKSGVPIKEYVYGDAVIPLKGYLSFGFMEPRPLLAGGVLDDKSKLAITGEPKIGKSRFALNLAYCLATGQPFLDVEVTQPVRVLFAQFEVSNARFHQRVIGLARAYNLPTDTNIPLYFVTMPWLHLDDTDGLRRFDRLVQTCQPDVVFLDPMYKIHGSEENSASDMQQGLYDHLDDLIKEHDISLIITHHVNKRSDAKGWLRVRGTGQLPAWVDGLITLDRPGRSSDIEATALLRSGEGFVKTVAFNDQHLLICKGDQAAIEIFCAEMALSQPSMTRRQLAARVAKEFSMTTSEVYDVFKHLEDIGFVLPQ